MIVKNYIKEFEKLGIGMFVHFGIYSVLGKGEWAYYVEKNREEYKDLHKRFDPDKDWAVNLVATAKKAGCKYITLTTRHHDGFSLYDTCGLSDYDTVHTLNGRDLIREFVDACRLEGIVPFFYHTLLDWHMPEYNDDFKAYLVYLRKSIEILCTNYGKIGGLWFDGKWNKPDEDWEEDALYALIRKYQPEAMIINNTGMASLGTIGNIELDSVTFERGRPFEINLENSPKYVASEMCEVLADYWGYAKKDFKYKSLTQIIESLCLCRKCGSNFLLNVGPMGNGQLRPLDKAMFETLGEWVEYNKEAVYLPRPSGIPVEGKEKDFMQKLDNCYYLFVHDLPWEWKYDFEELKSDPFYNECFRLDKKVTSVRWLDSGEDVPYVQNGDEVQITTFPQTYGEKLVVKILKIETE